MRTGESGGPANGGGRGASVGPDTHPARRHGQAVGALLTTGAFAVLLALAPSEAFDLERYLEPKRLALHLTALALVLLPLRLFDRTTWSRVEYFLAAFVAWGAASAALSVNPWLGLMSWGVSLSSLVVLLAARRVQVGDRAWVLGGVLVAAVLGGVLGLAQTYGLEWSWLSEDRAPGGTFGNRNFLGHVAALALAPLLAMSVLETRASRRSASVVGLIVLVAVVILTRSRAAWLGTAAAVLVTGGALLVQQRPRIGARRALGVALAVAVAAASAVFLPNHLEWSTENPYASTLGRIADFRGGSGRGRLVQYRNSLTLVGERPALGVGPGNWFVHYPRVTTPSDPAWSAHLPIPTNPWPSSDWIALLAERGVVGALLLLLAVVAAAWLAIRGLRPRDGPAPGPGAPAALGVLAAGFVTGLFDAVLLLPAPSFLFWVLVGLLLPALPDAAGGRPASGEPPRRARAPERLVRAGVGVGLVCLAVVSSAHVTAIATADRNDIASMDRSTRIAPWEHRLHLFLAERGRCDHAREAVRLIPYHQRAQELASRCGP